jgi:hypothetical protein
MRRVFVMLALSVFCAGVSAQAQEKPRIAVWAEGGDEEDRATLTTYLVRALNKTGFYTAIDRSKGGMAVRERIREFHLTEEGMKKDQTIKSDERFKEEYYCYAEISRSKYEANMVRVRAQMNHTATDTIVASTDPIPHKLERESDVDAIAMKLVEQMLPDLKAEREKVREGASKQTLRDNTQTYTDSRDGKKYRYLDDGKGAKWFMQDLGYGSGRYNSSEYLTACPVDDKYRWRVPNERDWSEWKRKMNREENKDLKRRFYETRDNRKRNYEKGLYWWSATPNQCVDDVKGEGCEENMDIIRTEVEMKHVGNDTKKRGAPPIYAPDTVRYRYWPQIRCVHD